ncbi:hypothetical protein [Nocardioides piscis]|uniref:Uncharacterized protein n=1 Tax=Nocardioides piscis TaxID=2714938 RepID=A0A6G7YDJ9_9ACTN|nr:hypothetical protein [Nocardioides piscis]QIK74756.1 hypothetical protein G7071_04260 [Nocardioides piscis]
MTDAFAKHAAHLLKDIQDGPIRTGWHWLNYNFTPGTPEFVSVAHPTAMALAAGDAVMPGFAAEQVKRLESLGGTDRDMGHYRQIMSWYCEMLVIGHLASYQWPAEVTFAMEPVVGESEKNPEILIRLDDVGALGVEVKAPDLGRHQLNRKTNDWQLVGRVPADLADLDGGVTFPRDNPVKDFLISADAKFAGFRAADPAFRSVLVIVWDDFVNEPLTALMAPGSGLFTPNSFFQNNGKPVEFPNVDAALLVRHQHQVIEGLAGRKLGDGRQHLLDYGLPGQFPPPALVTNPFGQALPEEFLDSLHAVPAEKLSTAAEYNPSEIVMWFDTTPN